MQRFCRINPLKEGVVSIVSIRALGVFEAISEKFSPLNQLGTNPQFINSISGFWVIIRQSGKLKAEA
jgi:hypothetical protein